jgi:hypothetical protein
MPQWGGRCFELNRVEGDDASIAHWSSGRWRSTCQRRRGSCLAIQHGGFGAEFASNPWFNAGNDLNSFPQSEMSFASPFSIPASKRSIGPQKTNWGAGWEHGRSRATKQLEYQGGIETSLGTPDHSRLRCSAKVETGRGSTRIPAEVQPSTSGSRITGDSGRQQTPYRCQSRNHGLLAFFSSCLRFAAETSVGLSGLVSGTVKMRSSHSISAMVCSMSIRSPVYPISSHPRGGRRHRICTMAKLNRGLGRESAGEPVQSATEDTDAELKRGLWFLRRQDRGCSATKGKPA